ncbi:MAG: hypothetical protein AAGI72_01540 [Pseudomonadota bacterium]
MNQLSLGFAGVPADALDEHGTTPKGLADGFTGSSQGVRTLRLYRGPIAMR